MIFEWDEEKEKTNLRKHERHGGRRDNKDNIRPKNNCGGKEEV
jgi:hypothetical protein